jgi:hypothetical protein
MSDAVQNFVQNLKAEVDANGEVTVRTMQSVRAGFGYGRLGPNVTDLISRKLAGAGLGHAPADLPMEQERRVLIFTLGSEVANVIGAVLNPAEGSDDVLRKVTGGGAADVIAQIRALVCE